MPPKKSPLKDGEDIKPDWINEQFDEHGGYDNLMGKSSTPGVAASMKKYMKKRGLKTSTTVGLHGHGLALSQAAVALRKRTGQPSTNQV